jgi:hypothetical protein
MILNFLLRAFDEIQAVYSIILVEMDTGAAQQHLKSSRQFIIIIINNFCSQLQQPGEDGTDSRDIARSLLPYYYYVRTY